jgi:hypothetical protein
MRKIIWISLFLMTAFTSRAATLPITSGRADLIAGPRVNESFLLNGSGFSFSGFGINSGYPCLIGCIPGDPIPSGLATLSSEDRGAGGALTVGNTGCGVASGPGFPALAGSVDIEFSFNLNTPGTNPPSSLTLTGPFTARAFFFDPNCQAGSFFVFSGQGLVTINLVLVVPLFAAPTYNLQNMHFDFGVPEPGTATLVCLAVAALSLRGLREFKRPDAQRS